MRKNFLEMLPDFRDGTTDVTRTLHFGTPTDYEKVQTVTVNLVLDIHVC